MEKEEGLLLAKAKRDYPNGTKFKSAIGKVEGITNGVIFIDDFGIFTKVDDSEDGSKSLMLYSLKEKKWAEIIPEPTQHDGYIVPYDIKGLGIKKGDLIRLRVHHSDTYQIIGVNQSFINIPHEIVNTWEKHYSESKDVKFLENIWDDEAETRYPVKNHVDGDTSPYFTSKMSFIHGCRFGYKQKTNEVNSSDFRSEVIKLLDEQIIDSKEGLERAIEDKIYTLAVVKGLTIDMVTYLLQKIKNL
jgi:hypothetical protein